MVDFSEFIWLFLNVSAQVLSHCQQTDLKYNKFNFTVYYYSNFRFMKVKVNNELPISRRNVPVVEVIGFDW